jgi:hypothetical protein
MMGLGTEERLRSAVKHNSGHLISHNRRCTTGEGSAFVLQQVRVKCWKVDVRQGTPVARCGAVRIEIIW